MPVRNIEGERFGRLLVVSRHGTRKNGQATWVCICDCGNEKIINGSNLRTGHIKSCGCLLEETRKKKWLKHGMSRGSRKRGGKREAHPLYEIWLGIRRRCLSTKSHAYQLYGGRGIGMHEEWKQDFTAFVRDVGERPSEKHSLDRIDNDGHYEPGNVQWATAKEQADNRGPVARLKRENAALIAEVERLRAVLSEYWRNDRCRCLQMEMPPEICRHCEAQLALFGTQVCTPEQLNARSSQ